MKVLFLIQSCNKDRYLNEEKILRETYLTRIRKEDCYYFYRGGYDKHEIIGDVIQLNCTDDLNNTFRKTIMAMSIFKEKDYDFIIRINTSNWINMEMLYTSLSYINPESSEIIGTNLITNGNSSGIPFLRGNMLIFTKKSFKDLFDSISKIIYTGLDDVSIGLNLCKQWTNCNIDYLKSIKVIKNKMYNKRLSVKDIKENVLIRCAEEIKKANNSEIIREIDNKYLESLNAKPEHPKIITTILGDLKLY